jgi:SSS family solute:Na+ symporter
MLRIDASALDYVIIGLYFVTVLGIGFLARRLIKSDLDFFLSGRSLPAWITGLAFISANLGALEILGMAANGAQYGVATVHFYWIGAIPAMLFLGVVMMPFYYGSKVRSVPEWLRRRYNKPTHLYNAISFAVATVLIGGVNLYLQRGAAVLPCSGSASCSRSATGRPTSPRCSAHCQPRT